MHRLLRRALPSVLVGFLLSPLAVSAGEPTDQLRSSIDQVIKLLEDPGLRSDTEQRRAAIRKVATNTFDFGEAARRSLGRHWQSLSEQDREEFTSLFADLLERGYVSRLEEYSGEKVAYTGDTVNGDLATVKTRFSTKKGTDIPVDYRMMRRGDRWLVYDVWVEGLSLVGNYRGQFNKIIETSSYQDLIKRMKARSGDLQAPPAKKKES